MKNRRFLALLFAVFLLLSLCAGCGSKSTMSNKQTKKVLEDVKTPKTINAMQKK